MIIIKNREMLIPDNEQYLGTTYDTESETRVFKIQRFRPGLDLCGLTFRLDLKYPNGSTDTVLLDKDYDNKEVTLTWTVTSSQVQQVGTVFIQIRAIDDEATVKWSSFDAPMYVERHLNTPGTYTGDLTEIEQMEQDHQYMLGVVDELKEHIDYAFDAEAYGAGTRDGVEVDEDDPAYHNNAPYYKALTEEMNHVSEAYAKGTVDGDPVSEGDPGYHDNAKYYKDQAAASAVQAAATVADTNARFDNAISAVTTDTELADIRVGADGVTYGSAGTAVRSQVGDLKSAIDDGYQTKVSVNLSGIKYVDESVTIPSGLYRMIIENISSSDTDATTCLLQFKNGSTNICSISLPRTSFDNILLIPSTCDTIRLFASDTSDHSSGDTVSATNFKMARIIFDISLTNLGKGADSKTTGDRMKALIAIANDVYSKTPLTTTLSPTYNHRFMESSGLAYGLPGNVIKKYPVDESDVLYIASDDCFQFQSSSSVATSGTSSRVGETYEKGVYILTPPTGATHIMVCTTSEQSTAAVYKLTYTAKEQLSCLFNKNTELIGTAEFSGTQYATASVSIPAGMIQIEIDSITDTDTDSTTCLAQFYNGETLILQIQFGREQTKEVIEFNQSCDSVRFYASDTITHATGDTFSVNGFTVYKLLTDFTQSILGRAADAKQMGDEFKSVKTIGGAVYSSALKNVLSEADSYRLLQLTGSRYTDSAYKIQRFLVTEGELLHIESHDKFQFQTSTTIPLSGINAYRVGATYGKGDYYLRVPSSATVLIASAPTADLSKVYELTPNVEPKPLREKKIVLMGDSTYAITGVPGERVSDFLANLSQASVSNCAFGGTRMSERASGLLKPFDFPALVDSILNGSWTAQDSALSDPTIPAHYAANLALLKTIDFGDIDILCVSYGTNDFTAGVSLGDGTSDKTTFTGAIMYCVNALMTEYPNLNIVFDSPRYKAYLDSEHSYAFIEDVFTHTNGINKRTIDYIDALMTTTSGLGIVANENLTHYGWNKYNRLIYFPADDGTHFNENGTKYAAKALYENICKCGFAQL